MSKVAIFPAQACVYVIGSSEGPQKIGVATNLRTRLHGIQNGNPYDLDCVNSFPLTRIEAFAVEAYAHWLLRGNRLRGEWFDVLPEEAIEAVQTAIADVAAGKTVPSRPRHTPLSDFPERSWQTRLRALGLTQKAWARLSGQTENTVSRQIREEWKLPQIIKLIIMTWEKLSPEQRCAVEQELFEIKNLEHKRQF